MLIIYINITDDKRKTGISNRVDKFCHEIDYQHPFETVPIFVLNFGYKYSGRPLYSNILKG